jgi:hypothetical protein
MKKDIKKVERLTNFIDALKSLKNASKSHYKKLDSQDEIESMTISIKGKLGKSLKEYLK